jgi:hypothetical protein
MIGDLLGAGAYISTVQRLIRLLNSYMMVRGMWSPQVVLT